MATTDELVFTRTLPEALLRAAVLPSVRDRPPSSQAESDPATEVILLAGNSTLYQGNPVMGLVLPAAYQPLYGISSYENPDAGLPPLP